jgi:hypothetical protein
MDEEKNKREINRITEEVDYDLNKICYINKYYKQINEASIILNEVDRKIEEFYPEKQYFVDTENPEIEVWEWILVPWWKISFEYKSNMIDLREREKKEAEEKAKFEKVSEDKAVENIENSKFEEAKVMKETKDTSQANQDQEKVIEKSPQRNFIYESSNCKNINMKSCNKVNPKEIIPDPIIQKEENASLTAIKQSREHELGILLNEDDQKIAISTIFKSPIEKKESEEKIMEEKCSHGEAIETLKDSMDENMLDEDYSLKAKIEKETILFDEKKSFRDKRETIENFLKTSVENMLEEGSITKDPKRRE